MAYGQCEGHLTAYEQFNFPGDPKGSKEPTIACHASWWQQEQEGYLIYHRPDRSETVISTIRRSSSGISHCFVPLRTKNSDKLTI